MTSQEVEPPLFKLLTFAVGLFMSLLIALEAGRFLGFRRKASGDGEIGGFGAIDGAIYGLMGLLIAFTFSGAASRYDTRRELITREGNAITTAYLRIDLVPAAYQPQLRIDMKDYADARVEAYRNFKTDPSTAEGDFQNAVALQRVIWAEAVAATANVDPASRQLVLSSVNELIDVTATRALALITHPPSIIYDMLVALVLVSTLLGGYEMGAKSTRSWLHVIVYIIVMTSVLYVIINLEYPRWGFIRLDASDQILIHVRNEMK